MKLRTSCKVVLATWYPRNPEQPRGGVEAVSVNLANALARIDGLDIHVVTLDEQVTAAKVTISNRITTHRLPRGDTSLLRFASGAGRRFVRDYLRKLAPDIVHAHDTFGIMTRGLALPRVFTVHGFIHEDTRYAGGLKATLRSLLWKREELDTWAEQPHIISISPYVRERLRGIARGVIHDIENPIDASCFDVSRQEDPGSIFSAAVISPRKNPLGLVKAMTNLNAAHRLRLAGPVSDESYATALCAYIAREQLSDRVTLLGSVPSTRIREELSRAAAFALVSFEEGAPMGIAEAMAAGVPVVTSNRCGMPYMVRHGETGFLVNPHDTADIAFHLDRLLRDDALRLSMGQAARTFAENTFHPDRVAERTIRVYERAIATHSK